jgi:hypothetical protein
MIEKNISPLEERNHVGIIELSNKRDWVFFFFFFNKYKTLRNLVMHDMIKKNSLGIVDFCFVNNGLAHNFGNEVIERLD